MTAVRDRRTLAFAVFALTALLVEWTVTRTAAFARGGAVPFAVFLDVMVVVPGVFVLFVLRPAKRSLLGVAPLLALAATAAGVLLRSRPETKTLLGAAGALAELAVLSLLVRRLRTGARELRGVDDHGDDLLLRIDALTDPVLRALGLELAVLYYALLGPRVRRPVRVGEFTYRERTGVGGLLFGLGLVIAIEGAVMHILVSASFPRVAWWLAGLDVYALVWLAAAFQAARLRPVVLSANRLLVRTSLLWTAPIPRDLIASVTPIAEMPRGKGVLRAAFGAPPELLLTLREPVVARGLMGIRKSVTRIAIYVDESERLTRELCASPGTPCPAPSDGS